MYPISLHDRVVINSTSGSDIHDGRKEVVFFYSIYRFFSGDWSHNTSEYSYRGAELARVSNQLSAATYIRTRISLTQTPLLLWVVA